MLKVGIILGSTRPGRAGEVVASWVRDLAVKRGDAEYEIIDLKDYDLGVLDEPSTPPRASTSTSTPGAGRPRSRPWTRS